jgi:hypothetical protein
MHKHFKSLLFRPVPVVAAALAAMLMLVLASAALAERPAHSRIYPKGAHPFGKSYPAWTVVVGQNNQLNTNVATHNGRAGGVGGQGISAPGPTLPTGATLAPTTNSTLSVRSAAAAVTSADP